MRPAVCAIPMSFDVGLGGVLLANMLVAWLDSDSEISPTEEAVDESQDRRTSPELENIVYPHAGISPADLSALAGSEDHKNIFLSFCITASTQNGYSRARAAADDIPVGAAPRAARM